MPSKTFGHTGGWQRFTVPKGVKRLSATIDGAGSGTVAGGRVAGDFDVKAGQAVWVFVGGSPAAPHGSTGGVPAPGDTGQGGRGGGGSAAEGTATDSGRAGGGASVIRLNSTAGSLVAVAGGAGGDSGDGGRGGVGGGQVGEHGSPGVGSSISPGHGNATGGTQLQGGNGGTSGLSTLYDGSDAVEAVLGDGGAGGGPNVPAVVIGGGGGGGGYHAGGGGSAGARGITVAGAGAGGSSYVQGIAQQANTAGGGATGNGAVVLTWVAPSPANQPPSPPTEVKLQGKDYEGDEHTTRSTGTLTITAKVDDPSTSQRVRMVVVYSSRADFSGAVSTVNGDYVAQTHRSTVRLTGLVRDTRYWARLYTQDSHGLRSVNYTSINFWANRSPLEPTPTSPGDNSTVAQLDSTVFSWDHNDPDVDSVQSRFSLRWRTAGTALVAPGPWSTVTFDTWFTTYVADPFTFLANLVYEWQVRTTDSEGATGPWSAPTSFYVTGPTIAPLLLAPLRSVAVDVTQPVTMLWKFRDPEPSDAQTKADIRWRPYSPGAETDWVILAGDTTSPGAVSAWTFPANTFASGVQYEWQVRTTDTLSAATSDWSGSGLFWGIRTPGSGAPPVLLPSAFPAELVLGCGRNRAFVYRKGGEVQVGEIRNPTSLTWGRVRDDISKATIALDGVVSGDNVGLLRGVHTWMHEIRVFRDGKQVWEGPITRIKDGPDGVQIEAWDVWAWVYRRIMRQGYNDAFRVVNGVELGSATVVQRAIAIIANALAPDDPNILPYLTSFMFPDDAGQSRVVPDFSKTAWEEVDDLAATAGLDYTAIGRRLMVWDTHRPIGRLPEMRTEHFSSPPVITEYGMQLATSYGVTNNSGIYGVVDKPTLGYGLVELLASAYGESEAGGEEEVLTSAARLALEQKLTSQAQRGIVSRYPAPQVVRVPDGSMLVADTPVDINHLVPGVWIPLRAKGQLRELAQWQKLDNVTVTQTASEGERVAVTMSPAPNGGTDPDSDPIVEDLG